VELFFGKVPAWLELRAGDVREVRDERFSRAVLDLPEPWAVLEAVTAVLAPGGLLCCYLPTTNQTQAAVLALRAAGYSEVETLEVLIRTWHVTQESVRPDHRMVAHTGFVTVGRRGISSSEPEAGVPRKA
jgi:tRNA (adenine57-N1/adenine58-N1)-methyltransferase